MTKKVILIMNFYLIISILLTSCCKKLDPNSNNRQNITSKSSNTGPKVIVYKTKKDFYKNVPVILSDDKSSINSFPDIKDVFFKGELAFPTKLHKGYLLDNRGISQNAAFLSYSYEEYSHLPNTPPVSELLKEIIDKDPMLEVYECGNRYQYLDVEKELNKIIDEGGLGKFTRLK